MCNVTISSSVIEKYVSCEQMQRVHEREAKLMRECERLRGHLLQIEEGYTAEALQAEEREKELRNKLAAAEEKALTSSTAAKTTK